MGFFKRFKKEEVKEKMVVNEELFKTFITIFKPDDNFVSADRYLLKELSKVLPIEMIKFYEEYGFGTFGNGIIKMLNPQDLMYGFYEWLGKEDFSRIPIFMTAFGDIIYYRKLSETEDDISLLNIHYRNSEVLAYSFESFFTDFVTNESLRNKLLYTELYNEALASLGTLKTDEIFMFTPALVLGGAPELEYLDKGHGPTHHLVLLSLNING